MNFLRSVLFETDRDEEEEVEEEVHQEEALDEKKPLVEDDKSQNEEKVLEIEEVGEIKSPLAPEWNTNKAGDETKTAQAAEVQGGIKNEETADVSSDAKEQEGEGIEEQEEEEEEDDEEEEEYEEESLLDALGGWGIGDIVKSIKSRSEEIFNEYKDELKEFGSGLRRETGELVEIAGHKVKDLPSSIDSSAHAAQETLEDSLEEVGQTIEDIGSTLWKGTKVIISHVKEAVALVEEEAMAGVGGRKHTQKYVASLQRGKYSRYESLVSAMQRDSSTYCDEPEDTEDFEAWKAKFSLEAKQQDIDDILKENAFMTELQSRIVPVIVEYDVFWTRYFFRLHKLQQAEDARANLVKRAANTEEEELSWDVDDDKEEKGEADKSGEASGSLVPDSNEPIAPPKKATKEDDLHSDSNSSGSEWQLLSKGGSPENKDSDKKDAIAAEGIPPVDEKAEKVEEEEKEAEAKPDSDKPKPKDGKKDGEDDEEWSEWE